MRFRHPGPPDSRRRRGLTLVEVLAALVIVSVGLLGMAGTSAISLRTAGTAARERRAVQRLGLRFAQLAAAGCQRAVSGSVGDAVDGVRERWTVAPAVGGAVLVEASGEWSDAGGSRSITLRSALLC